MQLELPIDIGAAQLHLQRAPLAHLAVHVRLEERSAPLAPFLAR